MHHERQSLNDVKLWSPDAELVILLQGVSVPDALNFTRLITTGLLNCIRALGGYTTATSPGNLFDTEDFIESKYYENLASQGRLPPITLNW